MDLKQIVNMLTHFASLLFQARRTLYNLVGHSDQVMSVDFHPRKLNLVASCDCSDEIRLWNAKESTCFRYFKVSSCKFIEQLYVCAVALMLHLLLSFDSSAVLLYSELISFFTV